MPALCNVSARVSPPIPPPTMTTSMPSPLLRPAASLAFFGDHPVPQDSDARDLHFSDVSRLHEHRRLPLEPDASGRPGRDHVAGEKLGEARHVFDASGDGEDHKIA